MRRRLFPALALAGVVLLSGCGAHPFGNPTASQHTVQSIPRVSVMTVGGKTVHVYAVFATDKARAHGLMDTTLPADSGAVFTWDGATAQEAFWMFHTPEPLSLVWIRAGRIVGHVEMVQCSLSCPTYNPPGPYDTAVEANAGTFAHVVRGEAVTFR